MTTLDDRALPKVRKLIARVGRLAVLKTVARTSNIAAGTVTETVTSTDVTVSPLMGVTKEYVFGTVVETDFATLLANDGLPVTPNVGDRLEVDGFAYSVIRVVRLDSGAQTAAWRLFLRAL